MEETTEAEFTETPDNRQNNPKNKYPLPCF